MSIDLVTSWPYCSKTLATCRRRKAAIGNHSGLQLFVANNSISTSSTVFIIEVVIVPHCTEALRAIAYHRHVGTMSRPRALLTGHHLAVLNTICVHQHQIQYTKNDLLEERKSMHSTMLTKCSGLTQARSLGKTIVVWPTSCSGTRDT